MEKEQVAELLDHSSQGEIEWLKKAIESGGYSPNARDEHGWSPLIMASKVLNTFK
jgi:ankyrin repeat protein